MYHMYEVMKLCTIVGALPNSVCITLLINTKAMLTRSAYVLLASLVYCFAMSEVRSESS